MKKIYTLLLSLVLVVSMVGCKNEDTTPTNSTLPPVTGSNTVTSSDFQKNLHQAIRKVGGIPTFVETDAGWYVAYGWLYYIEKDTMKTTIVCAKPDCDHQNPDTCNALIDADYLLTGGERIYYVGATTDPKEVCSVKPDATEREVVQELKFQETSASQSSWDPGIYHRGYVYYVSDDIIYRVKLGGEKDSAQIVWDPANPDTNNDPHIFNANWMHYKLWADGDTLYFMTNVQVEDGTYKDVLFQCDLTDMSVKQVWVTPDKDEVGEWEETGVSVSQWYVMNGYIYFYLSGGDMWRTELSSGKTEKLADTHEQAQYGSAIFSDDYMCLLNDYPIGFYGDPTLVPGGMFRSYGDTIFVYGMDGTLVKEISLKNLYDDPYAMAEMHLLCCAGNDIFFLTTGRTPVSGSGMVSATTKQGDINLCHANIDTGEVEVIYTLRKGQ